MVWGSPHENPGQQPKNCRFVAVMTPLVCLLRLWGAGRRPSPAPRTRNRGAGLRPSPAPLSGFSLNGGLVTDLRPHPAIKTGGLVFDLRPHPLFACFSVVWGLPRNGRCAGPDPGLYPPFSGAGDNVDCAVLGNNVDRGGLCVGIATHWGGCLLACGVCPQRFAVWAVVAFSAAQFRETMSTTIAAWRPLFPDCSSGRSSSSAWNLIYPSFELEPQTPTG